MGNRENWITRLEIKYPEQKESALRYLWNHHLHKRIVRRNLNMKTRCDANFGLAMEIRRVASSIQSEDEDRWIEVVQCVFKRLTDVARQAECDNFSRTAADVVGRYRV
jgi:hypothetical protein